MHTDQIIADMENLSFEDLNKIAEEAQKLIKRKKAEAERTFLARMKEEAKAQGIDLDAVLGNVKGNKGKGIPLYAHPNNPNKTWTGKGRKPNWVEDHLKNGGQLDDLKI